MNGMSAFNELILISRAGREVLYSAKRRGAERLEPILLRMYSDPSLAATEYALIGNGTPDHVLRPVEQPTIADPGLLVLEHFPCRTLHTRLGPDLADISTVRRIGIAIAEALGALHSAGVLHLALTPNNVLLSAAAAPESGTDLLITGLGHGRRLYSADELSEPNSYPPEFIEYLAPELFHAPHGEVGPVADYFSLGAILYHLLTGVPANPAAISPTAGSGIYTPPPEARRLRRNIPAVLSDLVSQLLAPEPGDRPASAGTIIHVLESTGGKRKIRALREEAEDPSGRATEQARVREALNLVGAGNSDALVVSGDPGIGKTYLMSRTLSQATAGLSPWLLYGKFEMDSTVPHLAFSQAIASVGREVLLLPSDRAATFRKQAKEAFSDLAADAVAVFPELSVLLSEATDNAGGGSVPVFGSAVSGKERSNLVQGLIVVLMELCTVLRRPTVLFIDDLQWADQSSMDILLRLVHARIPGLLVACAYRAKEISQNDPPAASISELRDMAGPSGCLDLAPLDVGSLRSLAKSRLPGLSRTELGELGRCLFGHTGGNPFYCIQVLKEMKANRNLRLDYIDERWSYHPTPKVADAASVPDAVRFLVERMKELSSCRRSVLTAAACSGRSISPCFMADALGVPLTTVSAAVEALIRHGFFSRSSPDGRLSFSHDNVRQAAHALLEPREEASLHLRFGRMQRSRSGLLNADELFDAAEHGNEGLALITDEDERFQVAAIDLAAGIKAKESGAFATAYRYVLAGLAAAPSGAWENHRDLMLALYREAAETAFLSGDYPGMDGSIKVGMEKCRDLFEELPFIETRINSFMARFQMAEIVELHVRTLRRLGFNFAYGLDGLSLGMDALGTRILLLIKGIKRLARPPTTDRRALAALRIMSTGFSAVYLVDRRVYTLACSAMLRHTLRCGDSPWAAFALVGYASSITYSPDRINEAVRLANFALDSARSNKLAALQSRLHAVAFLFVKPWADGFLEALDPLREGFAAGLKYGDYDNAGLCITVYCSYNILYGPNLQAAEREAAEYERILVELRQNRSIAAVRRHRQLALNLLGRSLGPGPIEFSGPSFDERIMGPILEAAADSSGSASYRCYMLFLAYLFGDYGRAVMLGESVSSRVESIGNQAAIIGVYLLFFPLSLAASLQGKPSSDRAQILRAAKPCRRRLRQLAAAVPKAYAPWRALVEAEFSMERGNYKKAEQEYFRAIGGADELGYLRDRALARERLALSYERTGKAGLARLHLQEACELYRQWGAVAKVHRLYTDYPWLNNQESDGMTVAEGFPKEGANAGGLAAFTDTLKRISAAATENSLAAAAVEGVLKITESDFGLVLLRRGEKHELAFRGLRSKDQIRSGPAASDEVPERFIAYVAHTGKTLLLDGPQAARTILCVPMLQGESFVGILYAEHRRRYGNFTQAQVEVIEQLGIHASASFIQLLRSRLDLAEEELRRQMQLAGRLADLGRRTASVVHELNNPNHLIGLGVDRIAEELRKLLVEQEDAGLRPSAQGQAAIEAALRDIRAASNRVDALIRDIKEIGGGKQELVPVDLNKVVDSTLPLIGVADKEGCPGLVLELSPFLPLIAGNVRKLQQIVLNLVENAIQASAPSAAAVRIATRHERNQIILEVVDAGEGIEPEHLSKVTSPFFTTRGEKGGTGLGLAIVEDLVRLHDGTMDITSRLGLGTRVAVIFPVLVSEAVGTLEG